ncbi:MAG: AAA family ATPase [Acidobacteria bacterium]|nr:AAA family ATPase [Acidobacteriota bacterium]
MQRRRIESITVQGFRRLHDVKLDLRPLSVLIGANGVGKTSVLDALALLSRSAKSELRQAVSDLGGISSLISCGGGHDLSLAIDSVDEQGGHWLYWLILTIEGVGYRIARETLSTPDSTNHELHGDFVFEELESSLSQAPRTYSGKLVAGLLSSLTHYHELSVEPRSPVRVPQQLRPADLPGRNGEDLVSCLFSMRESHRERFDAVEDSLRSAFPRFERLEFPPVAAGTVSLGWRERGFSQPFYPHQLSEGTLRYLWLTTLLQSPGLTALTLLDEPEVSLHPELLNLLADQFREASERTQLVVATHSDTLIRFLKPEEVVVMDSGEEGMTTLTRADELDLEEWLKDYSLDELWRNGRLGARA